MKRALSTEALLEANEAVFDWCLRQAGQAQRAGLIEAAAEWGSLAAHSAAFDGWFGGLASPALENLLLQLGATLPPVSRPPSASAKHRWLHVMTTAFEIGGHTNLVCRWMASDHENNSHSVILVNQTVPLPGKLRVAAEATGGQVVLLDKDLKHLEKAGALRRCAASLADVVVLHLHPEDVASVMAFAVSSEVPVCLMNHMDHLFWIGTGVADQVIEFRELGRQWTRKYRGVERSALLPLPLEIPSDIVPRAVARSRLGISMDVVVLLTVATAYKYRPAGEWNFLCAAERILNECPKAEILAVGPTPEELDGMWGKDVWRFGNRFKAFGCRQDLTDFYAAADIALGSFPFASQTALLECALHGLPCVPTPSAIRFGFDDVAFADVPCPSGQEDFAEAAIRLVQDAQWREASGQALATSVKLHHCGAEWTASLDRLKANLPVAHGLYSSSTTRRLEADACEFWIAFARLHEKNALSDLHGRIIANGTKVTPQHDAELLHALKEHCPMTPSLAFALRDARFKLGGLRRRFFKSPATGQ